MVKKSINLALFGFPGAGKGTQAKQLSDWLNLPHISTGDIFRALKNSNSELAVKIRTCVEKGELVSDELVTKITFNRLSNEDCLNGFILDGFPRTLQQSVDLMDSAYKLDCLININISQEVVIERLSSRRICEKCGAIYNLKQFMQSSFNNLLCPIDGEKLSQRADDQESAIKKRLELFEQNAQPIIDYFSKLGKIKNVNGDNTLEEVFREIKKFIQILKN